MDINFTLWSTNRSGGYKVIFEVANGLIERGHNVMITTLGGDHRWFPLKAKVNYIKAPWPVRILNPLLKPILKRPVHYYEMLTLADKTKMNFEPDFISVLAKNTPECDINIATWFPTSFAVYRSNKGVPIYFCQDFKELAAERGSYFSKMFNESLYLPMPHITISGWLKEWLENEYNRDVELIHDGIDHDIFYPREVEHDDDFINVMGIFRGLDYKGDKDLVNALKIVSEKIDNIKLLAVGKEEVINSALDNNINFSVDKFHWLTDDEMAELYSKSDIFVFASHVEGFGLPPLEAMACNTPVVTTDCYGVRDYINNGENAYLVEPKKPKLLAEKIIDLIENPLKQIKFKSNGLKTVKDYKWDIAVDDFEKALLKFKKEYGR